MKKKLIKQEKGAIATLVAFTVFMFVVILSGVYFNITTREKSQLRSDTRIGDIYGKDIEQINKIYKEQVVKVASYDKPYIPNGFEHIEGTWNNGFTIKGITQNVNDEFVWVPCVTDQTRVKQGHTVVTFGKTTSGKYNENNLEILPTNTNVEAEDSSVSEIRESVKKYGGFYIAKYEAGINGIIDNYSLATKTPITEKPLSQAGKGVWNGITREDALTVSKAMLNKETTGVKSTLISGEAWDTTLQWMVNASYRNEENKGYDEDSTGKGCYKDVSGGKVKTTGYYPINNIYDMAGNVWEWTTENALSDETSYYIIRGGSYGVPALTRPASYRAACESSMDDNALAFRVVIYK